MKYNLSPGSNEAPGHGDNLFIMLNGSNLKQYVLNKIWIYALQCFTLAFYSFGVQNCSTG